MKKNLLILGAGQYGQVAKETAEAMQCFDKIDFLDDNNSIAIGRLDDYNKFVNHECAFVAIGNPKIRMRYIKKLNHHYELVDLIHPQACISPSATVGRASIIEAFAMIGTGVNIDFGCIIMSGAVIGHNASVGACCQLKYNCTILENTSVMPMVKIDCNTVYMAPKNKILRNC